MAISKSEAREKVEKLVQKYLEVLKSSRQKKYTEEETKKDFILPLFEALGWEITNNKEVSAEESQSGGRVDYGFYINDRPKFYLEAKSLPTDLNREDFANQAIRYSWNKGITWAVLTDFESIKVFNAQDISKYLSDKQFFEIHSSQYLDRFDQLWWLSKEAFETDLIDKEAEKVGKKLQKVSVTELLYKDLSKCRDILSHDLHQWNPKVDNDLLDEGVQKLLDRLIFLRVAEDRDIEQQTLIPLVRLWESSGRKGRLYESMIKKFRELNEVYNSNLFAPHPFEQWDEYSGATEKVIEILYGRKGYYEYDFKVMPADVLGSVYENYLGYRLSQSKKGVTVSKDAKKRKEHGIYYTPNFIVDYIVKNALKPVLDKCQSINDLKKIKVLDPACGSGSFLVKAAQLINEKYEEFCIRENTYTKISILQENIYGVDLDPQAVEIARLNLLLNAFDERVKLPLLNNNIKNGNSLISGSDEELKKYFGKNFKDKKPFNWEEEFPGVFKSGGFNAVIGNPPWVTLRHREIGEDLVDYFKKQYEGASGFKLNLFPLFVELGLNLLKKKGILSFIIPNRLLDTPSYKGVREKFVGKLKILDIQDLPAGGFADVVAGNIILTIQNSKNDSENIVVTNFHTRSKLMISTNKVLQDENLTININANPQSVKIIKKIQNNKILDLKKICDIHVGMMIKNKNEKFNTSKTSKHKIVTGKDLGKYTLLKRNSFNLEDIEIFGGTKNISKHQETPKLMIRKTGNKILCSLDYQGTFAEQSVYLVLLRDKRFDLRFLNALLNSKLITFYFQNELITNPEAYPYIQHYDLERLPIIDVGKEGQKELIRLVSKILLLDEQMKEIPENSERWNSIRSEMEKIDEKIDENVYKLYGLTPEEIEIVEGTQ